MARSYGSFLMRLWQVSANDQRIEIQHLQSGGRAQVSSLAAAVDWIQGRWAVVVDRPGEVDRSNQEERG